jgi:hypothetical protein
MNSAAGTNGPPTTGDPFVSQSQVGNASYNVGDLRFTYRDGTGAIQDVLMPSTSGVFSPGVSAGLQQINLRSTNPQARTAGPAAAGDPFVLNVGTDKHFVYRDSGGTIWDAWYNGAWTLEQINSTPSSQLCGPLGCFGYVPGIVGLTNGPPAAGDPFVVVYGQQLHYVYRDANGNIQDAWYDGAGAWHLDQINSPSSVGRTFTPGAAGDPFVYVVVNPVSNLTELHFAFRDSKGNIFDAFYDGGGYWGQEWVGCCSIRAASGPVVSLYGGHLHYTYGGYNGAISDVFVPSGNGLFGNGNWTVQQLNLGGMTNAPSAFVQSPKVSCTSCGTETLDSLQGLSSVVDPAYSTFSVNGTCTDFIGNTTLHVAYRDVIGAIQHIWYDGAGSWHSEEVYPQPPAPCIWPLKLNGPSNPLAFQTGTAVSGVTFSATGGTPPYSFSASGLPTDGLSLSSSGALTGTPMTPATFTITVTVHDSAGKSASNSYTITVKAPPLRLIAPSSLSFAVGTALSGVDFTASGGVPGYSFSASGLPPGLNLSSSGALTGTPNTLGTFSMTVTLRDSANTVVSSGFAVTVSSATWTLSLSTSPVPINFFGVTFNISMMNWVVTPDWKPSLAQTISYPPKPVTLPVPPSGGPNTVTITVSGNWSTPGGLANGSVPISPGSGAICTSFDSVNHVCNGTADSWKVAYTGHPSETVSWLFTMPYVYDPSIGQGVFWVVLDYNGVNP